MLILLKKLFFKEKSFLSEYKKNSTIIQEMNLNNDQKYV